MAALTAAVIVSTMALNASAYSESWNLRQMEHAPTSEYCYFVNKSFKTSSKFFSINCTSTNADFIAKKCNAKAVIVYGNATQFAYLNKSGDSCKASAPITGINVTKTVKLNCPTSGTYRIDGNFKG